MSGIEDGGLGWGGGEGEVTQGFLYNEAPP